MQIERSGGKYNWRNLWRIAGTCWAAAAFTAASQEAVFTYDPAGNPAAVSIGATVPPAIEAQPLPQLIESNAPVTLTVVAAGAGLSYQWLSNGVPMIGATGDSLILAHLAMTNYKNFTVVISNSVGSITSAPVAVWADANGNGIPDWWEMQYFGNLNQTAAGDFDGDGVNNLDEYLEGTDPTDPKSFNPRLHLEGIGGRTFASPDLPYYTMGQLVTLTGIPDNAEDAVTWSGSITGTKPVIDVVMNGHKTITATFGIPLPIALDNTNLIWRTGGVAPWLGETGVSYDGVSAAQSGLINSGQQTWLQGVTTNLTQFSELSFWWSVSSQAPDGLSFSIDGAVAGNISGEAVGWQEFHAVLSPGFHTLEWTYSKSGNANNPTGIPFSDAAWVDELVISSFDPTCFPAPSGIVAWWPGDGNATNIAGTENGFPTNGAAYAQGLVGEAFSFAGSSQAVVIPYTPALDLGLMSAWTIEAWINPASFNNQAYPTIYGKGNWGVTLGLNNDTGALESWVNGSARFVGTVPVPTGQWSHVALVDDGTNRTLFVNGTAAGTGAAPPITPDASRAAIGSVGTLNSQSSFNGLIDELSIYSRALSANEISAIYNAGSRGKCTNSLPPVMVQSPQSQLGEIGGLVGLFAEVDGSTPFAFQWLFNGTNLPGAMSSTLILSNLSLAQGGAYSLVVKNPYGMVTSYVAQLSLGYPLTLGQVVSEGVPFAGDGDLRSSNQVDTYTFTAPDNLLVYLNALSWPNGGAYWTLTAQNGSQVFSTYMPFNDIQRLQLPSPGTYHLTISDNNGSTGPYSFELSAVQDRPFNYPLGTLVSSNLPSLGEGILSQGGQVDNYIFTAPSDLLVYVNAVNWPAGGAYWTLYGPNDIQVFSTYMQYNNIGRVQLPAPGTYRLAITDVGGNTGPYSFEVSSVQDQSFNYTLGTVISSNQPSAGEGVIAAAGQLDNYIFTAPASLQVFVNALGWPNGGGYWTLYGPNGQVFSTYMQYNNIGRVQLPAPGTYRLAISGVAADTGPYSFEITSIQDQPFNYTVGTVVSSNLPSAGEGKITEAGQVDNYVFTAPNDLLIYVNALTWPAGGAYWALFGPNGSQLFGTDMQYNNIGRVQLPAPGAYRLAISSLSGITRTYSFEITGITNKSFAINVGQTVSANAPAAGAGILSSPGEYDLYTFQGKGGQIISFVDDNASGIVTWTALAPNAAQLFSGRLTGNDSSTLTLPMTGPYTIEVQGSASTPLDYSFAILNSGSNSSFTPPNIQIIPIAIGATVSNGVPASGAGNLETSGAEDVYTFSATNGQTIYLQDFGSSSINLAYYRIFDPFGNQIGANWLNGGNNFEQTLGAAGTYTMTVNNNGGTAVGTYHFALLGVPAPDTFNLALGQAVSNGVPGAGAGIIPTPGASDTYTFTVTSGQTIYLQDFGSSSVNLALYRIYDPSGNQLAENWLNGGNNFEQTLGAAGTYTMTVNNNGGSATGAYHFALLGVRTPDTFNLALGQAVSNGVPGAGAGIIPTPGASDTYTFTVTSGQTIYLQDFGSSSINLALYRLYDPFGNQLAENWLNGGDNFEQTLGAAGTYAITVNNNGGSATGTYRFALLGVPPPDTFNLSLGQSVSNGVPGAGAGAIPVPGASDTYTFTATNGQTILLQDQGSSLVNLALYRIYDPSGNQLAENWLNGGNNFEQTLGAAGTYAITVNNNGGSATGSYAFALEAVNAAPLAASIPLQIVDQFSSLTLSNIFLEPGADSTLAYSFLDAPAGMTIDGRGVITWTPGQSQTPSTNIITLVATSTGNPGVINPLLSATNSFLVEVIGTNDVADGPPAPVVITATTLLGGGQFQFTFNAAADTDYTVQTSTNLIDWDFLQTINASGGTQTVTATNAIGSSPRYYRVKTGGP